mgnify:CR=1 FL=1
MGKARDYIPALRFNHKIYPEDLATGNPWANYWYVDGDNGSDSAKNGSAVDKATASLEQALSNAGRGDVIFVRTLAMGTGATDPVSYTENGVMTADKDCLSIVGVGTGRTQGGLPQLKVGATTTQAILTARAPGCYIANLGFNGAGATGGGILLDDDSSTKTAFGTTIENCHFKNCVGTTATDSRTGGAIQWSTQGNAWQVLIRGNSFYKNVGDIVSLGTSGSVPQDITIEDNDFKSASTAATDCNLFLTAQGGGMSGLTIRRNTFGAKPALSSGSVALYMDLTGCYGTLADNLFGCIVDPALSEVTFAAAGDAAKVPATVFMSGNRGEVQATGNTTNHAAIGRYA